MNIQSFTQNNGILMLAMDHRGSFQKILNPENPNAVSADEIITMKNKIISALEPYFSGVLIDPQYGLKAYPQKTKPFLLSIEKTGYSEQHEGRVTELEYTVNELKEYGASGVKLLLYFNPISKTATSQIATAKTVFDASRGAGLPLFLEIVTYNESPKSKSDCIVESVDVFLKAGISADVFKLDFPETDQACKQITDMLEGTPWILLTRGEGYETFKHNLEIAVRNGAKGFLAGRSVWQEIGVHRQDIDVYLQNTVIPRFREICAVVTGA